MTSKRPAAWPVPTAPATLTRAVRIPMRPARPRAAAIIERVCGYFDVKPDDVRRCTRRIGMSEARAAIAHLLYDRCGMSYPDIARTMGQRSHSTWHGARLRYAKLKAADRRAMEAIVNPPQLTGLLAARAYREFGR